MNYEQINISCVSYLNSRPFIDGLQKSDLLKEADLSLDVPSECAAKLQDGRADIGLVPIAVIPLLENASIISDFCIGAVGPVDTVLLLSDVPLEAIETIQPDPHSRTSVMLARVLADKYWNIHPEWSSATPGKNGARLLIGDKTFSERSRYRYAYDLAAEWMKFTSLPFVFACWISTKPLPFDFLKKFNDALATGVDRRDQLALEIAGEYPGVDIHTYLKERISFDLDDRKREGMDVFFRMVGEMTFAL